MDVCWYLLGIVVAWLFAKVVMDVEPDPNDEEHLDDWWRDLGGEAGGA